MLTRNKKIASNWYPEILSALGELRGSFVLDGEICVLDENGLPDFEGMRARTARQRSQQAVTYFAFDLLFHNGKDLSGLPLIKRKERLRKLMPERHRHIARTSLRQLISDVKLIPDEAGTSLTAEFSLQGDQLVEQMTGRKMNVVAGAGFEPATFGL